MIGEIVKLSDWPELYVIVDKILVDGNTKYICRKSSEHTLYIVEPSLITELYYI